MTLSSSIPFMMAHFTKSSVGLFWHNAADGWIDVKKGGQGWRRPAGGHLLDVRDVGPVCDARPWPQSCFHTGRAPHLTSPHCEEYCVGRLPVRSLQGVQGLRVQNTVSEINK